MPTKEPTPAEIAAMRQKISDYETGLSDKAAAAAAEAVKPARDLVDEFAGLEGLTDRIEAARIASARFNNVASIIENIGNLIKLLPNVLDRAEEQARADALAEMKKDQADVG